MFTKIVKLSLTFTMIVIGVMSAKVVSPSDLINAIDQNVPNLAIDQNAPNLAMTVDSITATTDVVIISGKNAGNLTDFAVKLASLLAKNKTLPITQLIINGVGFGVNPDNNIHLVKNDNGKDAVTVGSNVSIDDQSTIQTFISDDAYKTLKPDNGLDINAALAYICYVASQKMPHLETLHLYGHDLSQNGGIGSSLYAGLINTVNAEYDEYGKRKFSFTRPSKPNNPALFPKLKNLSLGSLNMYTDSAYLLQEAFKILSGLQLTDFSLMQGNTERSSATPFGSDYDFYTAVSQLNVNSLENFTFMVMQHNTGNQKLIGEMLAESTKLKTVKIFNNLSGDSTMFTAQNRYDNLVKMINNNPNLTDLMVVAGGIDDGILDALVDSNTNLPTGIKLIVGGDALEPEVAKTKSKSLPADTQLVVHNTIGAIDSSFMVPFFPFTF